MYAKLENGCFMGQPFTGMHKDAKYVVPTSLSDAGFYRIDTSTLSLDECVDSVTKVLEEDGYV
jgi:hypothetical protein